MSRSRPSAGQVLLRVFGAVVACWLILPVLIVIPIAFGSGETFKFPPDGLSTRWMEAVFTESRWRDAMINSLLVALVVVTASLVLGVSCALGLSRTKMRGGLVLRGVIISPLIIPLVVAAIGTYAVGLELGLVGNRLGFMLVHTALALPYMVTAVMVSLSGVDRSVEQAAANLGASPFVVFFKVTLPLIAPGVAAGSVFSFVISFDEVVISRFLSTPLVGTVPVRMFQSIESVDPTIAAASTVLLALTTATLVLMLLLNSSRRRSSGVG